MLPGRCADLETATTADLPSLFDVMLVPVKGDPVGRWYPFHEPNAEDHDGLSRHSGGTQELLGTGLDDLRLKGPDGRSRLMRDAILVQGFDQALDRDALV